MQIVRCLMTVWAVLSCIKTSFYWRYRDCIHQSGIIIEENVDLVSGYTSSFGGLGDVSACKWYVLWTFFNPDSVNENSGEVIWFLDCCLSPTGASAAGAFFSLLLKLKIQILPGWEPLIRLVMVTSCHAKWRGSMMVTVSLGSSVRGSEQELLFPDVITCRACSALRSKRHVFTDVTVFAFFRVAWYRGDYCWPSLSG